MNEEQCKCETVKSYDGVHQCMMCSRKFIAADTVHDNIATGLEKRQAQISVMGNMLIAVLPLTANEIHEYSGVGYINTWIERQGEI